MDRKLILDEKLNHDILNKNTHFLRAKFNDRWPFPTGVIRGPLRPILLVLTDSIALVGIFIVPSGAFTGVTSTTSHSTGV